MDEIVIEDKKYISTKRAAKATGYAKDYVGQLCREGRVPARLVGRSWYVLESALADHRFGNEVAEVAPKAEKKEKEDEEEGSKYPRYQADEIEEIETLTTEFVRPEDIEEKPERETIKDAWEAWFDRVAKATVPTMLSADKKEEKEEEAVRVERIRESVEEEVLIHAVTQEESVEIEGSRSTPVVVDHKRHAVASMYRKATPSRHLHKSPLLASAKIGGGLVAIYFSVAFVLSTGVFDPNIISGGRDVSIAGISVYNK